MSEGDIFGTECEHCECHVSDTSTSDAIDERNRLTHSREHSGQEARTLSLCKWLQARALGESLMG